jgi:glycosyltransferase involved in cell wall biosynthesis
MLEAMAAARPVVVTPVGGIAEMIEDGSNGLLVPPGDVDALAAALRRLFVDPALARSLALRGHRAVRERFDAQEMVRRLGTLYESLRPAGRPAPEYVSVQSDNQDTSRAA